MAGPGILLTIALLFGGGGSGFPATEMLVELTGVIVLVSELWQFQWSAVGRTARVGLLLVLLAVLLPLAQLVPLPPIIWQNLPGREFIRDAANVLGSSNAYLPISLDPDMTLRSEFALLPGVAMTLAAFRLNSEGIRHLLFLMIAIAMASVMLSSLQIAMGPAGTAYLYITSHEGLATGFFANRNHQGSFLDVTYLCAAALAARSDSRHRGRLSVERILLFAMMGVCLLGTLATASRTASAVALVAVALTIPWFVQVRVRVKPSVIVAVIAVIVLALAALYFSSGFQFLLQRYQASDDARAHFWPDVIYAIGVFFPVGSGLGTFDPVFRSIEQLSIVGPLYVNDAHNDFMQLALETGVVGLLLLAATVIYLGRIAYLSRQRPIGSSAKVMLQSALYGILIFALHSLTDYPLRTLAAETILGLFFGRVLAGAETRETARRSGRRPIPDLDRQSSGQPIAVEPTQ
jgi:O-antigen ligase